MLKNKATLLTQILLRWLEKLQEINQWVKKLLIPIPEQVTNTNRMLALANVKHTKYQTQPPQLHKSGIPQMY